MALNFKCQIGGTRTGIRRNVNWTVWKSVQPAFKKRGFVLHYRVVNGYNERAFHVMESEDKMIVYDVAKMTIYFYDFPCMEGVNTVAVNICLNLGRDK